MFQPSQLSASSIPDLGDAWELLLWPGDMVLVCEGCESGSRMVKHMTCSLDSTFNYVYCNNVLTVSHGPACLQNISLVAEALSSAKSPDLSNSCPATGYIDVFS